MTIFEGGQLNMETRKIVMAVLFMIITLLALGLAALILSQAQTVVEGAAVEPLEKPQTPQIMAEYIAPDPKVAAAPKQPQEPKREYLGEFEITNYTLREEECGKAPDDPWYGITASGEPVEEGVTIAADWTVLPKGTKVFIEGVGIRTVYDKGGAIKGKKIDVYVEDLTQALEWGRQKRKVWIIKEEE